MAGFQICIHCKQDLDAELFELLPSGNRRTVCIQCRKKRNRARPEVKSRWRQNNPCIAIYMDCKNKDRKSGFVGFDLDKEFIEGLISQGCIYCGETKLRMTLDRIDNSIGHLKCNVLPCCFRCNYIRGSMPFEAWQIIVPAVRQARESGLFGDWRSEPFNRKWY